MTKPMGEEADYGSEDLCKELRIILVKEFNIMSLINGQLSISKSGPKSAMDP